MQIEDVTAGGAARQWPPAFSGDATAVAAARRVGAGGEEIVLRGGWGTITPSWAEEALKGAVSNLGMSQDGIDVLATDMAALKWRATGEAIIMTHDSLLLDGRKRLSACVKSGVPFVALLVHGVPKTALDTMNNLRGRKLSDILHIQGEPNYRSLATALTLLWRMRDGGYDRGAPMGSDRQLLALLEAHPTIRESLAFAGSRGRLMRLPLFTAAHFMIKRVDHAGAVAFSRALMDDGTAAVMGDPDKRASEGSPARAFNDLILHSRSAEGGLLDRDRMSCIGSFILAFNAFQRGVSAKALRWAPIDGNGVDQPFPEIVGWKEEFGLTRGIGTQRSEDGPPVAPATVGADGIDATSTSDIMAAFERHPRSQEVWQAAFPDGIVPTVSLKMIGRHEAAELLDRNTANRGKVTITVERYRRDIESGDFLSLNGATIKVARSGRMLDGQHRITGLEKTGLCLPFLVVEGLDEQDFDAMDRADTKTFADVLRERDVSNAGTIAAATRVQWLYERSEFRTWYGLSPSNPEMGAVLRNNPELAESLEFNNRLRGLLIPAIGCWIEYRLKKINRELGEAFLLKLVTGEGLERGNPILLLRKRLSEMELARLKARRDVSVRRTAGDIESERGPYEVRQAALTILAFNMWAQGRVITQQALRWRDIETDGFPQIDFSSTDVTSKPEEKKVSRRRKAGQQEGG